MRKSAVMSTVPEHVPRMNKTTVIDPQLPTPQIAEVIREARKSGLRSMRVSLYDDKTRPVEDIIDCGTQTSPGLREMPYIEVPDNFEAGVQINFKLISISIKFKLNLNILFYLCVIVSINFQFSEFLISCYPIIF